MNTTKLKGLMAEKDVTKGKVAEMLGISRVTLAKRLKDGSFSVTEMRSLINELNMTEEEINNIFLN